MSMIVMVWAQDWKAGHIHNADPPMNGGVGVEKVCLRCGCGLLSVLALAMPYFELAPRAVEPLAIAFALAALFVTPPFQCNQKIEHGRSYGIPWRGSPFQIIPNPLGPFVFAYPASRHGIIERTRRCTSHCGKFNQIYHRGAYP